MAEFYVWVFTPSAVRDGYQVGAYSREIETRLEMDFSVAEYDADEAADLLWRVIEPHGAGPTFYSDRPYDAPLSAALRDALTAKANGTTPAAAAPGSSEGGK